MTKDSRAKRDARALQERTGGSYVASRRVTSQPTAARFNEDQCANCMQRLAPQIEGLFCSELCGQYASTVRYWRRIVRDGRIDNPDVRVALNVRIAHLLAGGYARRARHLPDETRAQVWRRDENRCRTCGAPGSEIDHIADDSPDLANLQLLCTACHRKKTESRMSPASNEQQQAMNKIYRERVVPDQPMLLCDDQQEWASTEAGLRAERRGRLLDELAEYGYDRREFPGYSWQDMWDAVLDEAEEDDFDANGIDDDSGFGPDSYFARAMAKDD
ncbi:HNH endonuclease [Dactylosporangium cerinum]|uniref:HNH endonuclease n=1 Tax=Dactylosporangium cerinum TaxID=1434730 RepID=A0ABV9VUG5_9ACTN